MHVHVVDPSAFTPTYDHSLCEALGRAGVETELFTSAFPYGALPAPAHYARHDFFYRTAVGPAGSRTRTLSKLLMHAPDMVRYRSAARAADVVHYQWLPVQWLDHRLLARRPTVLTAHDLLPREPHPLQERGQRRLYERVDAVIVHSRYGRAQLEDAGVDPGKIRIIHHGAFAHLAEVGDDASLPDALRSCNGPVALFFGLLRPYKGLEVLLEAWRGIDEGELWIVGRPRMRIESLRDASPPNVRLVTRYVSDEELGALFRRADVVVLPYSRTPRFDQSGVLATALAFGKATILSDVGGFAEVAAIGAGRLVPPGDPQALRDALRELLLDEASRVRIEEAARAAASGPYSWDQAASLTLELYEELVR